LFRGVMGLARPGADQPGARVVIQCGFSCVWQQFKSMQIGGYRCILSTLQWHNV